MTKSQEKLLAFVAAMIDGTRVSYVEFHEDGTLKIMSAASPQADEKTVGFEAAGGTLVEMTTAVEEEDEEGDATARIGFR